MTVINMEDKVSSGIRQTIEVASEIKTEDTARFDARLELADVAAKRQFYLDYLGSLATCNWKDGWNRSRPILLNEIVVPSKLGQDAMRRVVAFVDADTDAGMSETGLPKTHRATVTVGIAAEPDDVRNGVFDSVISTHFPTSSGNGIDSMLVSGRALLYAWYGPSPDSSEITNNKVITLRADSDSETIRLYTRALHTQNPGLASTVDLLRGVTQVAE